MGELATTKMLRSFGSHAKSNFDRTLSCGFDMESDPMRTTKKLSRASTNPSGSRKLEFDGSRGRGVTDEGLIELATTLNEPQTNIEGLSLRYLKISDEACAALADAMAENWTLARVELHGACPPTPTTPCTTCPRQPRPLPTAGNQISAASCERFAEALKRHPKLAILELGSGPIRKGTIPYHVYSKCETLALLNPTPQFTPEHCLQARSCSGP